MFLTYDDSNIFAGVLLSFGSVYPKGPYIGLPSYAQPIIGECFLTESNSLESFTEKLSFSKLVAIFCEYDNTT